MQIFDLTETPPAWLLQYIRALRIWRGTTHRPSRSEHLIHANCSIICTKHALPGALPASSTLLIRDAPHSPSSSHRCPPTNKCRLAAGQCETNIPPATLILFFPLQTICWNRSMVYLFYFDILQWANSRLGDWFLDVCFEEISFSAFNRGIKNGCQQIASGPDPESLLIKMDHIYYITHFSEYRSLRLLKCTVAWSSERWKKRDENQLEIECH